MTQQRSLVLDANILIRAVLGKKVRTLLEQCSQDVSFFSPDVCFEDAQKYLPVLLEKRQLPSGLALEVLARISRIVQTVESEVYLGYEEQARQRIAIRDSKDWPIVATALALDCPIWTEDSDFFGSGIATWTTDRVHLFVAPTR